MEEDNNFQKNLPSIEVKNSAVGFREMFPRKDRAGGSVIVPIGADNFQENIDYRRLSKTLVKRLWICAVSAIGMALLGFFVLDPLINDEETYTASTHLLYKEYKRDGGSFSVNTVKDMIVMAQNCQAARTLLNLDLSVEAIQGMCSVTINRKSNFLILSATTKTPELSKDLANTLGEMAVKNNLSFYKQKAENLRNNLRAQADSARLKAKQADDALIKFQSTYKIIDMQATRRMLIEAISSEEFRLKENENSLTAREVELKAARQELAITPKEISKTTKSQSYLTYELQVIQRKYIDMVSEYGAKNPKVLKIQQQMNRLKEALDLQNSEKDLTVQVKNPLYTALKLKETEILINLEKAVKIRVTYQNTLKEKQAFIQKLPELQVLYNRLIQHKADASILVETLDQKAREVEMAFRSPIADFEVYEPASDIAVNRKIPRHFFTMGGAAFGASFSFLILLFLGILDRRIVTRKEIEAYYKVPCLAAIPQLHEVEMKMINSPFSGHIQNMAEKMAQIIEGSGSQVISFCGAFSGEGKSSIANELSGYYSRLGLQTVYMDFDHRSNAFFENTMDISNFLDPSATNVDSLFTTHDNLSRAKFDFNDDMGDRLKTMGSTKLLEHLKEKYDVILLDSPGVLERDYSSTVNTMADHVVFVVKSGATRKSDIDKALRVLEDRGISPVGMVLNGLSSDYQEKI
jgi:capsular polysaccharide biosynthesis protein